MKLLNFCFSAVFLISNAPTAMAERIITVEPGLWEYTHSLEIPGLLGPVATPKTECIAPEDAQRSLDDLFEELSDGTGCAVSNLKDTLNTVEFDLNCKPALESIVLQSTGHLVFRYGRTKITGLATGAISINGAEMTVVASGSARRIGRCKK